jgi:D-glycero-alpha-D-manno-heptose-7-phosphate kinase
LHYVKELGYRSRDALEGGDLSLFGQLMNEHWNYKKNRSGGMTNSAIDRYYRAGMENGALGGKIVGAGGGGFLMFLARDKTKLRSAMTEEGLEEVRFKFDFEGCRTLVSS